MTNFVVLVSYVVMREGEIKHLYGFINGNNSINTSTCSLIKQIKLVIYNENK